MYYRKFNYTRVLMFIIFILNCVVLANNTYRITRVETAINALDYRDNEQHDMNKQIIDMLQQLLKNNDQNVKRLNEHLDNTSLQPGAVPTPKNQFSFNSSTDLCEQVDLTSEDMNKIIDGWDSHVKNGTAFKDKGYVFIEASKITGLNPVYILAHAAWESSWGNSNIARLKNNYFGINATDANTYSNAYAMGDSVDEGIIKGAIWIKQNFYNNGCTNLEGMIYEGNYASAQGKWIRGITSIANASLAML